MTTTEYDPSEHTNQEVLDHLASADPDEVQRVLALEAGEGGRQRVGILRPNGALPEDDAVDVELVHHWTDAAGDSHSPGATVSVPLAVAEQLVNARFATSEQLQPEGTPSTTVVTGEASADTGGATV